MAYSNVTQHGVGYLAGADLTAGQYTFVNRNSAGKVITATANAKAIGVLWNAPNTDQAATVITGGQPHVYASAAIAVGAEVAVGTGGKAKTAASTNVVVGYARTAATAADQLIMIDFLGEAQFTKA